MIGNEHNGLGIETLKHRIQRYAAFIGNAMCHADVCPIEDRETYDILTASHHTLQQASYDAPETISASAADVTQYLDQAEDDTTLTPEQQPRETKVGRTMISKQQRDSFQVVCDVEALREKIDTLVRKSIEQGSLTHAEKEFLAQHEDTIGEPSQNIACFI